jgi:short subunit dehydrogenase-like uncharacterized protein
LILADPSDQRSIDTMVGRSRVVLAAAGPFSECGSPVVDACVRLGTDYVDITGETPWVRGIIDAHHEAAVASGTRIVPMCGFDSVPSDLGTWFVGQSMWSKFGQQMRRARAFVEFEGELSGGTLATGIALERGGTKVLRQLADPFLLGGRRSCGVRAEDRDVRRARWQERAASPGPTGKEDRGRWTGPFVMATINTRVVRRSAELFEAAAQCYATTDADTPHLTHPYGEAFSYQESMVCRDEAMAERLARPQPPLEKRLEMIEAGRLPAPGQGPSKDRRAAGRFVLTVCADGDDGCEVVGTVTGACDPGYEGTARMASEAAVLLATEEGNAALPAVGGGVLTPSFCFGQALVDRLSAAGIDFAVRSAEPACLADAD